MSDYPQGEGHDTGQDIGHDSGGQDPAPQDLVRPDPSILSTDDREMPRDGMETKETK